MRDSWIDRDELDELVGSFSSARKGKGRRIPARSRSSKGSDDKPGNDPEPMASAPEVLDVSPAIATDAEGALVESGGVIQVSIQLTEIEPSTHEPADVVLDIFEFDDESGDDDELEIDGHHEEVPDDEREVEVVEFIPDVHMPAFEGRIEEAIGELPSEIEAGIILAEQTPPPLTDLPIQELAADTGGLEARLPERDEPELVLSTIPEEAPQRELPLFLDDADDFVPRTPTLSERDADRALIALAEARARAEQGGLLRGHRAPVEDVVVEPEVPTPLAMIEVLEEAPRETKAIAEEPTLEAPGDALEREEDGGTFFDRIERFVVRARRELGATAAAVSDHDGFLLFTQSDREGDVEMETALLLEIAGKTDRLLGVEHGSATQVSTDGGAWRCLIRGGDGASDLYAGFHLRRPLDQEEIVRWRNALAEIISRTP